MTRTIGSLLRITLAVAVVSGAYVALAQPNNGFDLTNSLIDPTEIVAGGPAKDGIPALDNPRFVSADKAGFMQPQDRILGIELNGVSKAYPIGILNWHEIVNDSINGEHFAVTYCPLCGTGVAFSARVDDKNLDFGVSGLLYNSDVLLYDRQSDSLWSQIKSQAISGKMRGKKLSRLPLTHTNWSDWLQQHPKTQVLSQNTGYARDYSRNPYAGYEQSRALYFEVSHRAPAYYHPKERVLGLQVGDAFKAYPFSEIDKAGKARINDLFAGERFTIHWDRDNQRAEIYDAAGKPVPAIEGFWFAWFTFHPETEIYRDPQS
jgi:hypothetical protein